MRFAYGRGGASLVDLLTAERNDNEVRLAAAVATRISPTPGRAPCGA